MREVIGIIPARYKSTRFEGKPLIDLLGKPMIIRVANIVAKALGKDNTIIATDDDRIFQKVEEFGYQAIMTSSSALTGTDRIHEVACKIESSIYINIQGDEPLLDYRDILNIYAQKRANMHTVINGMHALSEKEDPKNVNLPKVVVDKDNHLLYMSRLPVPGSKSLENNNSRDYFKQVCIYAFTKEELNAFASLNEKPFIEKHEDIEILRFLYLGIPVKMVKTNKVSLAIDEPSDVEPVLEALKKNK